MVMLECYLNLACQWQNNETNDSCHVMEKDLHSRQKVIKWKLCGNQVVFLLAFVFSRICLLRIRKDAKKIQMTQN